MRVWVCGRIFPEAEVKVGNFSGVGVGVVGVVGGEDDNAGVES